MNCHHFNRIRISDNEFISTTCSPAAATRREPDHAVSRSKSRFLPASPGVIHREKGRPRARCEKVFDPTEAIFSRSEPPFAVSPAQDKRALQIVMVAKQIVPRAGTRRPQARQTVLRKNKKSHPAWMAFGKSAERVGQPVCCDSPAGAAWDSACGVEATPAADAVSAAGGVSAGDFASVTGCASAAGLLSAAAFASAADAGCSFAARAALAARLAFSACFLRFQ